MHFAKGFVDAGSSTPEDMVQDAILRVWLLHSEGKEFQNLESLLVVVLKNVCLDYLKLKKNQKESLPKGYEPFTSQTPQQDVEMKTAIALLRGRVASLPMDQRIALRLRDVMGCELSHIAYVLDTTEPNVRTLLSRARKALRYLLCNGNV